jgi:hypothetical protein
VNGRLHHLATRIRDELLELERVTERVAEGWNRALRNADDYYLDGVVLNLHGFCTRTILRRRRSGGW